jgi:hypothetical protein
MYEQLQADFRDLRLYARNLTDLKDTRIRHENRIYADVCLDLEEPLGKTHPIYLDALIGADYTVTDTEVVSLIDADFTDDDERKRIRKSLKSMSVYGLLCASEKAAERMTTDAMLGVCSGPAMTEWLAISGVGPPTVARVLGEIGHPVIAFPMHWEENPDYTEGGKEDKKFLVATVQPDGELFFERMVSQLWSYCGLGDASRKHYKGESQQEALAAGSKFTKSLIWNLAQPCLKLAGGPDKNGVVKPRSPYKNTYDDARAHYDLREGQPCEKCKGQPCRPIHRHNMAVRKVMKTMLRDLWVAARSDLGVAAIAEAA